MVLQEMTQWHQPHTAIQTPHKDEMKFPFPSSPPTNGTVKVHGTLKVHSTLKVHGTLKVPQCGNQQFSVGMRLEDQCHTKISEFMYFREEG